MAEDEFTSAFEAEMAAPTAVAEAPTPAPETEPILTAEEKANAEAEPAKPTDEPVAPVEADTPVKAEPETPKYATKSDVLDAMREYSDQTTGRVTKVSEATKQIIDSLHPEGIDRNIYDTNNNIIKTAQDIVDRGLTNERTQEPFTYEEAASFMLQAQQKMAENVTELDKWAEGIAEKNISLVEDNTRVLEVWGDVLQAMPNVAKDLAERYITTQLEFDKTGSYITRMGMSPVDFYNVTLAPYRQLGEALAAKEQLETAAKSQEQQDEQAERNGIPPRRGQSKTNSNTGDPMLDALVDELNKG